MSKIDIFLWIVIEFLQFTCYYFKTCFELYVSLLISKIYRIGAKFYQGFVSVFKPLFTIDLCKLYYAQNVQTDGLIWAELTRQRNLVVFL